jgi:hypothetical protein
LKALLENYFKLSIIFLRNLFEKNQKSKYYFLAFNQLYASLLAKEMSYKMIYKVSFAEGMFEKYIPKTIFIKYYSPIFQRFILRP